MFSLALTGYPLSHSLSPQLHNAALRACGLKGSYKLLPAQTEAELRALLERLRNGDLHGLNVTIPHKQTIIPLLDELTPTARAIGAVNTIYRVGDTLIGDNTDAAGFWADLNKSLTIKNSQLTIKYRALILGAGGAARAIAYALATHGWELTIAVRRLKQAQELAANLQTHTRAQIQTYSLVYSSLITHQSSLIINATPLGMTPHVDTSPWLKNLPFPSESAVYDLVYNPRETRLVRDARAAGLPAVTGLGMLIEQAALAFELWTGQKVNREVMWDAVR